MGPSSSPHRHDASYVPTRAKPRRRRLGSVGALAGVALLAGALVLVNQRDWQAELRAVPGVERVSDAYGYSVRLVDEPSRETLDQVLAIRRAMSGGAAAKSLSVDWHVGGASRSFWNDAPTVTATGADLLELPVQPTDASWSENKFDVTVRLVCPRHRFVADCLDQARTLDQPVSAREDNGASGDGRFLWVDLSRADVDPLIRLYQALDPLVPTASTVHLTGAGAATREAQRWQRDEPTPSQPAEVILDWGSERDGDPKADEAEAKAELLAVARLAAASREPLTLRASINDPGYSLRWTTNECWDVDPGRYRLNAEGARAVHEGGKRPVLEPSGCPAG